MFDDKRKLPRFQVSPCQFHEASNDKNFSVQDISTGGLALRLVDRSDLLQFAVGSIHEGLIKVDGAKTSCSFQVRFIRGTLIGAEWVNPTRELGEHLENISHPETLGPEVKQYDLPEITGTTWFHHPVGIDLLFYPPNGNSASATNVGRWMIYVHQNFVQWEIENGVRTGKTMAEDEEGYAHGIVRLETRLVEIDSQLNQHLIRWVSVLVNHCHQLPEELRALVTSQLQGLV